ncbi:hypothetical protein RclHR1_02210016 [Rhizophagus clarus]|uniref:Alpha/beta hydrolase protein n=1 Tax=Rhizophagus clarus TaxID=94130 RepID=A0A2Z6R9Q9_9GLOM|nr:hypothetical protein RclHR1_02210016 [Rhizophagus clarus]GET00195.1 alpha/beta hydrolase protein [Rhizophagus clarus]
MNKINHIIAASKIRNFPGKNDAQLRLSVDCYKPHVKGNISGDEINIVFAHATGFHKEIWEPVIKSLFDHKRLNIGKILSLDHYNHGDSAILNKDILPDSLRWWDLAYDISQVINHFQLKKPLVGIGHSIGGAAMIMTELIKPGTFSCIVCVDPVLSPQFAMNQSFRFNSILKRRDIWPNREVAKTLFLKHEMFQKWDPEVLDIHMNYGLHELPDGQVTLKCPKLQEYYTFSDNLFASPSSSPIDAFYRLHEIECPILFLTGENSHIESEWGSLIKTRTQRGEWCGIVDCGHLVTMEKPKHVAFAIEIFVFKHLIALKDTQSTPNNPSRIDKYTNYVFSPEHAKHKL